MGRTKKKKPVRTFSDWIYIATCYISIDTSISNIRLKLLRVILHLNVWPKNTQRNNVNPNALFTLFFLNRNEIDFFHSAIVCYFVIFNTCFVVLSRCGWQMKWISFALSEKQPLRLQCIYDRMLAISKHRSRNRLQF